MRTKKYPKRKTKILYGRVLLCLLCIGAMIGLAVGLVHKKMATVREDSEIANVLQIASGKNGQSGEDADKLREILQHKKRYPKELLEKLKNNEEVAGFVYDYPKKKDMQPANSIGTIENGTIPQLLQWDERWGYATYADNLIAINGCAPTALAMVAAGLTGNARITPYKVAKYAEENGYYVAGTGTAWSLMTEGCKHFGVTGEELILDKAVVMGALEDNNPIICSMRPGDFTTEGHFIVLVGVVDGQIQVYDPNSIARSTLWDYDRLAGQIHNLWVFTKN